MRTIRPRPSTLIVIVFNSSTVRVGYVYDGSYTNTTRFASPGGAVITGSRTREEVALWGEEKVQLGGWDASGIGLGGFSLNVHHSYNPVSKRLVLGDGRQRSAEAVGQVVADIADPNFEMSEPDSLTVAPDGRVYYTDDGDNAHQVLVINLDGSVEVVAGTGTAGNAGDGGPAKEASLYTPQGLYLRSDGTLLVSCNDRVRAIDAEGIITTIAGGGSPDSDEGKGLPATEAFLETPDQLALGLDGSLYIAELDGRRVRRVDTEGIITTFAGGGTERGDVLAVDVYLREPSGIAVDTDGSVYISERRGDRIVRVSPNGVLTVVIDESFGLDEPRSIAFAPDGGLLISDERNNRVVRWDGEQLTTVVGSGTETVTGGIAARNARIPSPDGIALGSDGSLYIASDRILRISPALPDLGVNDIALPSLDGSQLFVFDGSGRHLQTRDAMTSAQLLSFEYNEQGQLAGVVARGGLETVFNRNDIGQFEQAIGPYGQTTRFALDDAGRIVTATDPLGRDLGFAYGASGLLEEHVDAAGGSHRFSYDNLGRLLSDTGPTGFEQTLSRNTTENGTEVSLTTPMGRERRYGSERGEDGATVRRGTDAAGLTSLLIDEVTERVTEQPDGSTTTVELVPDVRWQMQVPFASRTTLTTPGGRELEITGEQSIEGAPTAGLMTSGILTESFSIGLNTITRQYDADLKTLTFSLGEERNRIVAFDEQGRVTTIDRSGFPTVSFDYDEQGRVTALYETADDTERVTTYNYDDNGYLASVTDALGNTVNMARDSIGRTTSISGAMDEVITVGFNQLDLLSTLTPPGQGEHQHEYDAAGLLLEYSPPPLDGETSPTTYSYNADQQLFETGLPDQRNITNGYDAAGRLATIAVAAGTYRLAYDSQTGRLSDFATPEGDGVAYSYDGPLLLSSTWSGTVVGQVNFDYDDSFRVNNITVAGGDSVSLRYDRASTLISAGSLTIERAEGTGLPQSTRLRSLITDFSYNAFAELSEQVSRYGSGTRLTRSYTRDALGRIIEVSETIEGETKVTTYAYDASGRLISATDNIDGVETEQRKYRYDANGNRVAFESALGEQSAEYDEQDRIVQYGNRSYERSLSGDVQRVTDSGSGEVREYEYDELGQLKRVTLPDGSVIRYRYDLVGRRIAKSVDNERIESYIYQDRLRLAAKLDAEGNVEQQYIYGIGVNVPDVMIQDGVTYALIRDQVGSVRLVVNASNGEIAQRIDYDEFGKVIRDTNPGLQPFGFAGRLYDADTGLVRFGFRDYDPVTGRWTVKDPVLFAGGQTNLYSYVGSDPVNYIDSNGLWVLQAAGGLFGAGAQALANYDAYNCGRIGGADYAASIGVGLVVGVLATLPTGIVGGAVAGSAGSGFNEIFNVGIGAKDASVSDFGQAVALGGLSGGAASGLGKLGRQFLKNERVIGQSLPLAPPSNFGELGGAIGTSIGTTASMLVSE